MREDVKQSELCNTSPLFFLTANTSLLNKTYFVLHML